MTSSVIKKYAFYGTLGSPPGLDPITIDFEPFLLGGVSPYVFSWSFDCGVPNTSTLRNPSIQYSTHGTNMTDNVPEYADPINYRSYRYIEPGVTISEIVAGEMATTYGEPYSDPDCVSEVQGGLWVAPSVCTGYQPTPPVPPYITTPLDPDCEVVESEAYCIPISSTPVDHDYVLGATCFELGMFGTVQLADNPSLWPGATIDFATSDMYRYTDMQDQIHTAISYVYVDRDIDYSTWGFPCGYPNIIFACSGSDISAYSKTWQYFNNAPRFYALRGQFVIPNYFTSVTNKWFYEFDATISNVVNSVSNFSNITGAKTTLDPFDTAGYEGSIFGGQRVAYLGHATCAAISTHTKRLRPHTISYIDIDITDTLGTCLKNGMKIWISPVMEVANGNPDPAIEATLTGDNSIDYEAYLNPQFNFLIGADLAPTVTAGGITVGNFVQGHPWADPADPIGDGWTTAGSLGVHFSITGNSTPGIANTVQCRLSVLSDPIVDDGVRYFLVRISTSADCDPYFDPAPGVGGGGGSITCVNYVLLCGWCDETSPFNEFGHRAVIRYHDPGASYNIIDANNRSIVCETLNSYITISITNANAATLTADMEYDRTYSGAAGTVIASCENGMFYGQVHNGRDPTGPIFFLWTEVDTSGLSTLNQFNLVNFSTIPEYSYLNDMMPFYTGLCAPPVYPASPVVSEFTQTYALYPFLDNTLQGELLCYAGWPLLVHYTTAILPNVTDDGCAGFLLWNIREGLCCWGSGSEIIPDVDTPVGYYTGYGTANVCYPMLYGSNGVAGFTWVPPWLGFYINRGTYIPMAAVDSYIPSVTYTYYSLCEIFLAVTDSIGTTASDTEYVALLYDPTSVAISLSVADYTFNRDVYFTSSPITFTATVTNPIAGATIAYSWDFGDGTTATGNPTTHSFTTEGNFAVTVTCTDSNGATYSATSIVEVREQFKVLIAPSYEINMSKPMEDFSIMAYNNVPYDLLNPPYTYIFTLASTGVPLSSAIVDYYHYSRCYQFYESEVVDYCYQDIDLELTDQTAFKNTFSLETSAYGTETYPGSGVFQSNIVYIELHPSYDYAASLAYCKLNIAGGIIANIITNSSNSDSGYATIILDQMITVDFADTFTINVERDIDGLPGINYVGYNHFYLTPVTTTSPPEDTLIVSCVDNDGFALVTSDPVTIKWL